MSIRVANPVVSRTVDGGYSGTLTATVGTGNDGIPPLMFVESDLVGCDLVLSMDEARELAHALSAAVAQAEHLLASGTPLDEVTERRHR